MPVPDPVFSNTTDPAAFTATLVERMRGLIARGQLKAATLLLPTLEKLSGDRRRSLVMAAEIAIAKGDHAEAVSMIANGLTEFPQEPELLVADARLKFAAGNLPGAAIAAADAILNAPANAEAKSLLGLVLLALGRTEQAAICLREAFGQMPTHMPTLQGLSRAAPDEAEAAIRGMIAEGNMDIAIHNALIALMIQKGDCAAAEDEIRQLDAVGRADAETGLLAVRAAIGTGHWDDATALFNQATGHLPRHA
ncbi:MAG: tetratricopeptide repeat protein [Acidiphilium sp.]